MSRQRAAERGSTKRWPASNFSNCLNTDLRVLANLFLVPFHPARSVRYTFQRRIVAGRAHSKGIVKVDK